MSPIYIDEHGKKSKEPVAIPMYTIHVGPKQVPVSYRVNEDGCWICTSHGKGGSCYPRIGGKGRDCVIIFKELWIEKFGKIPKGKILMTTCPEWMRCINPDHRKVATYADIAYEKMHPKRPTGTDHFLSKLTPYKAKKVLRLKGKRSAASIAEEMGCSDAAIYRVWRGESWNQVTEVRKERQVRIIVIKNCGQCPYHQLNIKESPAGYCMKENTFFSPKDLRNEFPSWCHLKKKKVPIKTRRKKEA